MTTILFPPTHAQPWQLTDSAWERIAHLFPAGESGRGRPRHDVRRILDAVLWACFDDHKWHRLPSSYPSQQSCYAHFLKWRRDGTLAKVAEELEIPYDLLCAVPPVKRGD
jgi:transposase